MAKKDFSKVNTNPLYNTIQEAAEPMPGQVFLDGTEPNNEAEQKSLEDAATEMQQETAEVENPEDAPAEIIDDFSRFRRNKPRAGKIPLYVYISPESMEYICTMAGLQGITRQDLIENMLQDAAQTDALYKQALALRKKVTKGK